jgi:hypothetical protein
MEGRCGTDALRLSLPPSEIVRRLGSVITDLSYLTGDKTMMPPVLMLDLHIAERG